MFNQVFSENKIQRIAVLNMRTLEMLNSFSSILFKDYWCLARVNVSSAL